MLYPSPKVRAVRVGVGCAFEQVQGCFGAHFAWLLAARGAGMNVSALPPWEKSVYAQSST